MKRARQFKVPKERPGRLNSWRPGVPIVLGLGQSWHLPLLDDRMVYTVGLFVPGFKLRATVQDLPPDLGLDHFGRIRFVVSALSLHYRTRLKTLIRMVEDVANTDGFNAVVDDYLREFHYWATIRPASGVLTENSRNNVTASVILRPGPR